MLLGNSIFHGIPSPAFLLSSSSAPLQPTLPRPELPIPEGKWVPTQSMVTGEALIPTTLQNQTIPGLRVGLFRVSLNGGKWSPNHMKGVCYVCTPVCNQAHTPDSVRSGALA